VQCQEATLQQWTEALATTLDLPVHIDRKALDDATFDHAATFTFTNRQSMPLQGVLDQLLRTYDLEFNFQKQMLLITTKTAAEASQNTYVLAIPDLLEATTNFPLPQGKRNFDFDSTINMIASTVQPTTWKQNGGQGDINPVEQSGSLVITTTFRIYLEVLDLVETLRKQPKINPLAKFDKFGPGEYFPIAYRIFPPERAETTTNTTTTNEETPQGQNPQPKKSTTTTNVTLKNVRTTTPEQIATIIKKTVVPESWEDKAKLEVLGDVLLIHQTRAGHEAVTEQLSDLDVLTPPNPVRSLGGSVIPVVGSNSSSFGGTSGGGFF
jgi:hypothetical protein